MTNLRICKLAMNSLLELRAREEEILKVNSENRIAKGRIEKLDKEIEELNLMIIELEK